MPPRLLTGSSLLTSSICSRCRLRGEIDLRRRARLSSTAATGQAAKWALLTNKRLIRLAGPDAANFLHTILPAKILGVGTAPIYTAFLAAQGRIMQDVFIYPPSWGSEKKQEWLIEVDAESAGDLMKHLKRHKLRSKFAMELVDGQEVGIWYRWPSEEQSNTAFSRHSDVRAGGLDPRPGMGIRLVLDRSSEAAVRGSLEEAETKESSVEEYTIHRMLNGLAEGQQEIISGHALPQESNLDFLGGIDFHKGCYLGQELTIRTHHTGVVRKRILPCQLYDGSRPGRGRESQLQYEPGSALQLAPRGSNISKLTTRKGRSTGKWLGGVGNIGLALCRLEMMTDIQLTADCTNFNPSEEYRVQWDGTDAASSPLEVRLQPFVPAWIRQGITDNLERKQRPPEKADNGDEDDVA